jgi:hypothetical protein
VKKLLLILFIPIISFSQTFEELSIIDSLDDFKKVMIENKYEFDSVDEDERVIYGFNLTKDSINGNKSEKWGSYSKDGSWSLLFFDRKTIIYQRGDYDDIVEGIKDNCSYVDIENELYVSYRCDESEFDGKIGFMISDSNGYIRYFPKE